MVFVENWVNVLIDICGSNLTNKYFYIGVKSTVVGASLFGASNFRSTNKLQLFLGLYCLAIRIINLAMRLRYIKFKIIFFKTTLFRKLIKINGIRM